MNFSYRLIATMFTIVKLDLFAPAKRHSKLIIGSQAGMHWNLDKAPEISRRLQMLEFQLCLARMVNGFFGDFMGFYGALMGCEWYISSGYVKIATENGP